MPTTATRRKPKTEPRPPADGDLAKLADGCAEFLRYLKWMRRKIRAEAKAVDAHETKTLPLVEAAEKLVGDLRKRLDRNKAELERAEAEMNQARESHREGDDQARRLDRLVQIAPREVIAPLITDGGDDGDGDPPDLASHRELWAEFFGGWVVDEYVGLFRYGREAPSTSDQADEARRGGIPIPIIRQILRRRRDALDGHGAGADEARAITVALTGLREWEES